MKTKQEIINVLADYRPRITWDIWSYLDPDFGDGRNLGSSVVDQKANQYFENFMEKINHRTPLEDAEDYIKWYLTQFDNRPWEEIKKTPGKEPIEDSSRIFRFQVGTSETRAKHFLENGSGFVRLENRIGSEDWDIISKYYGLQVSKLGGTCRSEYPRLHYYATQQSSKTGGDKPCVLIGGISVRNVYGENNAGEFAISCKDYQKIQEPEILSLQEYQSRFTK